VFLFSGNPHLTTLNVGNLNILLSIVTTSVNFMRQNQRPIVHCLTKVA